MKVAELVHELSKLPPGMDVMVSTGRGLCWIETVVKRDSQRATPTGDVHLPYEIPGEGPFVRLPGRVDLWGRTLWFHDDPGYRLRGRWARKVAPLLDRVERIENERALLALSGRRAS